MPLLRIQEASPERSAPPLAQVVYPQGDPNAPDVLVRPSPTSKSRREVHVQCETPTEALETTLQRAAPLLAAALAQRLLITSVPRLHLALKTAEGSEPPAAWRWQKRSRRLAVHGAMQWPRACL